MTTRSDDKDAKDILADIARLAKEIHEYQLAHPPTLYFIRESDDKDEKWREKMREDGWIRWEHDRGMQLASWRKDFCEPIGVLRDDCIPEFDKDGKKIGAIGFPKPKLPEYIPLEIPNPFKKKT